MYCMYVMQWFYCMILHDTRTIHFAIANRDHSFLILDALKKFKGKDYLKFSYGSHHSRLNRNSYQRKTKTLILSQAGLEKS